MRVPWGRFLTYAWIWWRWSPALRVEWMHVCVHLKIAKLGRSAETAQSWKVPKDVSSVSSSHRKSWACTQTMGVGERERQLAL